MLKCNGKCETGRLISRVWICSHNNLEINRPNLMLEWHPDNKIPMSHYTVNSNKKVKWLCSNNTDCDCHEWETAISGRTRSDTPNGCPFCVNKQLCEHNNLATKSPHLAIEWHPDNPPMSAYPPVSGKVVKWICSKNMCGCHIWSDSINHRVNEKNPIGCPFCVNQQLCDHNNLEALRPELIMEWHPDNLPMSLYSSSSHKKVKWICSKNNTHIWNAVIGGRTRTVDPSGCPQCVNSGMSKVQIKWLTEIEYKEGIYIQHFCKEGGEYTVPNAGKVDGYCEETNTVYEFHGTFWHGDPRIYNIDDMNPVSKKTFGELYDKTLEKEQKIRDLGYNLVVMWELDYL